MAAMEKRRGSAKPVLVATHRPENAAWILERWLYSLPFLKFNYVRRRYRCG